MQNYLYAQLRADRGLINLDGCAYGDAGCRRQFVPTATDATMDPETEKQELLRAHLFARALPTGRGYAALHDGVHETHLGRVCVGAGAEGTHYLTVYADPVLSGDGRLSASSDGYMSTAGDSPVEGVESFGWWQNSDAATGFGCFCVGDDAGLPSGQAGLCNGAVPGCAQQVMPPASRRVIKGYTMHVVHLPFAEGVVPGNAAMMGCVSYGQWRHYQVQTNGVADATIHVQLSHQVGGLYAAAGRVPTASSYDLRAQPPLKQLTLSPCDATAPTTWHFAIMLGEESEGVAETLFTMLLNISSAQAQVDDGTVYTGSSCCGGYSNWLVQHVPGSDALSVNLTVLSGSLHAVFLQYDACPTYAPGDRYRSCEGLCTVGWITRWDVISGAREEARQLLLTVPMGETLEESDKRRAGSWYVGVKALPGEAGEYAMSLSLAQPRARPPTPYCSGVDRFCASTTQRFATVPVSTVADARRPGLDFTVVSAAARGGRSSGTAIVTPLAVLASATAYLALASCARRSR